jgi:hypothetical protein
MISGTQMNPSNADLKYQKAFKQIGKLIDWHQQSSQSRILIKIIQAFNWNQPNECSFCRNGTKVPRKWNEQSPDALNYGGTPKYQSRSQKIVQYALTISWLPKLSPRLPKYITQKTQPFKRRKRNLRTALILRKNLINPQKLNQSPVRTSLLTKNHHRPHWVRPDGAYFMKIV